MQQRGGGTRQETTNGTAWAKKQLGGQPRLGLSVEFTRLFLLALLLYTTKDFDKKQEAFRIRKRLHVLDITINYSQMRDQYKQDFLIKKLHFLSCSSFLL